MLTLVSIERHDVLPSSDDFGLDNDDDDDDDKTRERDTELVAEIKRFVATRRKNVVK